MHLKDPAARVSCPICQTAGPCRGKTLPSWDLQRDVQWGWVRVRGTLPSLHWDAGALLQTGLVEARRSWQGAGMKEGGEERASWSGKSHLPASSHMAVPPPWSARPHLKLPLPASRAAEHLLPWRWPLAALWVPSQGLEDYRIHCGF